MAFKYRNAKTGEVISTTNRVSGKNWVPVEDPPADPPADPPVDPPADPPVDPPADPPVNPSAAPPKEKSAKKGKR